jgi:hypothetical protein
MVSSVELAKKKVYQAPTLHRYGNLTEMTTANSQKGTKDGTGKGNTQKTG